MSAADGRSPALPPIAYHRMALVLRVGLAIAGGLLAVALVAYLRDHPGGTLPSILEHNPIGAYLDPVGLVSGLMQVHAQAFLTLGILVLVATPLARVATGCYYFVRGEDRPLARISAIVLVLLIVGILVLGPLLR
ncbi:MAG: DUF1634 domain-containing protein [Thermoplasmata archaeon]